MEIARGYIHVPPNRQRKEFAKESIATLARSIETKGLLHPIVVRELKDEFSGTEYELVCGERRLRAMTLLEWERIPCTLLSDLDPISRREAELEENILRVDLTYQERDAAIAELHHMRKAGDPAHTNVATARELSAANGQAVITNEQAVARALLLEGFKNDPQVQAARTSQEAYKIATAKLAAEFAGDLSSQMAAAPSPHTLVVGDCKAILQTLPEGQFDCIIVDPPYGMGADSFGNAGAAHNYQDNPDLAWEIGIEILRQGRRICKSQAHLYMFCDIENFVPLREAAEDPEFGWKAWRTPVIWAKPINMGHNPIPERGFRRTYEMILYAIKGDKPCNFLAPDVLSDKGAQGTPEHAARKPAWLYELLIKRSCRPGDLVLDPCCGSGTIFEAAKACHVRATGIEIDEGFATIARGRM